MVHLLSEKLIYLYTIYNIYIYMLWPQVQTPACGASTSNPLQKINVTHLMPQLYKESAGPLASYSLSGLGFCQRVAQPMIRSVFPDLRTSASRQSWDQAGKSVQMHNLGRPSLLGWTPSLGGWMPSLVIRLEAIASRLEVTAIV